MEEMGVIRKVEEPTDWCHPIVLVRKENGSIRLCLDLTRLNTAVKREFYQLESVNKTFAKLGDCNIMSKLDANSGYWQMPLDEDSQLRATFITPFGRFCLTGGPFGLSSMQEIFNKRLDKIISGLPGVVKSTDYFLVTGKDMAEHDQRLRPRPHVSGSFGKYLLLSSSMVLVLPNKERTVLPNRWSKVEL